MPTIQIEEIYKQTFYGIKFFNRDTNLDQTLISKYKPGQILKEVRFTDMSYINSGLKTNCRYMIATAHARNLAEIHLHSYDFGHMVLAANSYFKVLDIYQVEEKCQISLLHIPEAASQVFASTTTDIERNIVQQARQNFLRAIQNPVDEILGGSEWLERTEFPLGLDENGHYL